MKNSDFRCKIGSFFEKVHGINIIQNLENETMCFLQIKKVKQNGRK